MTDGLAQLVLTLLETLRQLTEKQAMRRVRDGSLTGQEIERLGLTFMKLRAKIREIAAIFNLSEKDLGLNLGPLGDLVDVQEKRPDSSTLTLVDLLDRVIEKGVVVFGDLGISVADVELISIQLRLVVSSVKRTLRTHDERGPAIARRRERRPIGYLPETRPREPQRKLMVVVPRS